MAGGSDATIPLKQTKFNAGEFSPQMYGDTAHPKYSAALKTLKNWIPIPEGAAVLRPGTRYINTIKNQSAKARLIPFIFSDNSTFILEFGNLYIRFYTLAQFVNTAYGLNTGTIYELVTQYTTAMLPYLKYKQVGNTITLCYGGQVSGVAALPPMDLVKTSGANGPWTISNTITAPPAMVNWNPGQIFLVGVSVYSASVAYAVGSRVTYNGAEWTAINPVPATAGVNPPALALNAAQTGIQGNLYWTPSVDLAHPAVPWALGLTVVYQASDGVTYESRVQFSIPYLGPIAEDRPLPVAVEQSPILVGATALYYNYYRGQNGIFGLVSQLTLGVAFTDLGNAPDYTQQPPAGTDPFLVNGSDSYPSVVGYIDQRRAFADSLLVPNSIQTSDTGNLYRFDQPIPGKDSDATTIVLASDILEQIRSFLALKCNLVFSGQGEWVFPDQVYTRSSGGPRKLSAWGSSWLDPVAIGNGCLFNTVQGNQVRDFFPLYGIYTSIWDGDDLTATARHFFEHSTITAWAFQSVPYPVLWMARSDGILISVTYERATQSKPASTVAWAQHYTGVGPDVIESIAVVPEPPEAAVYMIVNRTIGGATHRYIERMASPIPSSSIYMPGTADLRYAQDLDCATLFDYHQPASGGIVTIDPTAHHNSTSPANFGIGAQVNINIPLVSGGSVGFLNTDPGTANLVLDPENVLNLGSFQVKILGYTNANTAIGELQATLTQAQVNAWALGGGGGYNYFGIARTTFSVPQLAGYAVDSGQASGSRGVTVLADGNAVVPPSFSGAGTVTLTVPSLVTNIGISYNADMQLLDAYHPNAEIRNKYKNVKRVGFEVAGARSLWVGQDFTALVEWNERDVADSYNVMGLDTGYFSEFAEGDWNTSGSACLRHFDPLPCIVVSVLRELAIGGD